MADQGTAGFVDLQVNGYGGVDFNAPGLSVDEAARACQALRRDGVRTILATVCSERIEVMADRLDRLARARRENPAVASMIAGFHLEGPFINPVDGFRGAHPADAMIPADREAADRLLEAGSGLVRMVTLAPERDPGLEVTRYLSGAGITVAAGHTDASLDQLEAACEAGLSLFTHLGNGCPAVMARHDNIVQRAFFLRRKLAFAFIADGAHIPFFALRNYLDLVGLERTVVVTDAMSAAGAGPGLYRIGRLEVEVGEDQVARNPGTDQLAGAAVSMPRAFENLVSRVGLTDAEARRLTVENPAALLAGSPG